LTDTRLALLVVRCQLGEADALDHLVTLWHHRLWRYVRTLVPNDEMAGEAIQDVWLGILRGLPTLRDPLRFRGWAYRIAHHAAMDQLRKKYADAFIEPLEDHEEGAQDAGFDPDRALELEALSTRLMELPLLERNVLSLFYLQELSLTEIADVVNAPVGTVKSRLFRARRMLRALMASTAKETNHA
jgi:RNA polymerase sigma factor (sigma-70 family)